MQLARRITLAAAVALTLFGCRASPTTTTPQPCEPAAVEVAPRWAREQILIYLRTQWN